MSEMEIEISYNFVSEERMQEIIKNCSKIMMELFVEWLKEQNDSKE